MYCSTWKKRWNVCRIKLRLQTVNVLWLFRSSTLQLEVLDHFWREKMSTQSQWWFLWRNLRRRWQLFLESSTQVVSMFPLMRRCRNVESSSFWRIRRQNIWFMTLRQRISWIHCRLMERLSLMRRRWNTRKMKKFWCRFGEKHRIWMQSISFLPLARQECQRAWWDTTAPLLIILKICLMFWSLAVIMFSEIRHHSIWMPVWKKYIQHWNLGQPHG